MTPNANWKRNYGWQADRRSLEVEIDADRLTLKDGEESYSFTYTATADLGYRLERNGVEFRGHAARDGDRVWISLHGRTWCIDLEKPGARGGAAAGSPAASDEIVAPMTGTVRKVMVEPGALVERGQPVIVLEAMKMEHVLKAPRDGEVASLDCSEGNQADSHQVLLRLKPVEEGAGESA